MCKCFSSHLLHRVEGKQILVYANFVDGHDAGMLELSCDLSFIDKSLHQVIGDLVVIDDTFENNISLNLQVEGLGDDAAAPSANLAQFLIAFKPGNDA